MSIIQNKEVLAKTPQRADALTILEAGLAAISPDTVLEKQLDLHNDTLTIGNKTYHLNTYERIIVLGFGKCAEKSAQYLEQLLGDSITAGCVISKTLTHTHTDGAIQYYSAAHPLPDNTNIETTRELLKLCEHLTEKDLVITLVSGGGSALLYQPTYPNMPELISDLTIAGATIQELNIVRKHLSHVKGGNLASLLYPATVASIIFSDVPSNDLSTIASGPTFRDTSTRTQVEQILKQYDMLTNHPDILSALIETPKDQSIFARVQNFLALTNQTALQAMQQQAKALGYDCRIVMDSLQGHSTDVAALLSRTAIHKKECLLYGGETTVLLNQASLGKGGRNQETALASSILINDERIVISCASDGYDNTPAAGAIADKLTRAQVEAKQLDPQDYLSRHDSYTFFSQIDSQIITGDMPNNISDLFVVLS